MPREHAHHPHHHGSPRAERPGFSLVRWSTPQRLLAAALLLAPLWAATFLVTR